MLVVDCFLQLVWVGLKHLNQWSGSPEAHIKELLSNPTISMDEHKSLISLVIVLFLYFSCRFCFMLLQRTHFLCYITTYVKKDLLLLLWRVIQHNLSNIVFSVCILLLSVKVELKLNRAQTICLNALTLKALEP